jgi:hypothetical protein
LTLTGSVPTKSTLGSSPIGSLSRIVTDGLEIVDLEERWVDIFGFPQRAQLVVNLDFHDDVRLMRFGIDDPDGLFASLKDRSSLLGT